MRWLVVALIGGCYAPASTRCEPCSGVEACPGGLACIDGLCQAAANACDRERDGGSDGIGSEPGACFGVQLRPMFEVCPAMVQSGTYVLPATIDTRVPGACTYIEIADLLRPESCVIAADRIVIDRATRAIGTRPLVVLARELIQITGAGALLVNGTSGDGDNGAAPPAANVASCASPRGSDNMATAAGAGGGPGGTFLGRGGAGAAGNGAMAKLSPNIDTSALSLRGGCRGGDGGQAGDPLVAGGLGGNSGGAVYLVAPAIQIDGTVNASGGGGRASLAHYTGGAGGGSGGMILVWSETLVLGTNAKIFALGGGGGTGVGDTGTGVAGADPQSPTQPAGTTTAPSGAGDGGGGGAAGTIDGKNGVAGTTGGGGGGGGGVGYIKLVPAMTSAQIAPPSS